MEEANKTSSFSSDFLSAVIYIYNDLFFNIS